jgi:sugar/nucleoside kinase (ribokinase family)
MDTPRVVVVGDAALDVVARHTGPIVHGDDVRAKVTLSPGGAAANTAAWLAHLGVPTTLVSRVGDDPAGTQVRRWLAAAGVDCAFTVDRSATTGCVVVLVDAGGQRSMLPDRGANAALSPDDLVDLAGAAHLHLSGYVLLDPPSRPAGVAALAAARAAGLTTSVDPQAANLISDPAGLVDLVRDVDLFLPNEAELARLTGSPDPVSAAGLLAHGAVAVTLGAAGAAWVTRDGTVHSVPATAATCVDTTGAGDAFNAGLLRSWLRDPDPGAALRAGTRTAAAATAVTGAWPVIRR